MNFLLTFYIYPLKEKITLSESQRFYLDNPRTEEEISVLKDYLIRAYESGYDLRLPIHSDEESVTIEDLLFGFRDEFSQEDKYVREFFQLYERERVFEFIARMWVVARFDNEGEDERMNNEHKKMLEEGEMSFVLLGDDHPMSFALLGDDHPIVVNSERLANYCSLLSLMCHSDRDKYFGTSLLLDPKRIDRMMPPSRVVWLTFFFLLNPSYRSDAGKWEFLPTAMTEIRRVSSVLEDAFSEGLSEKLIYIGSILRIASHHTADTKVRVLLLTTVIELLLTHNPNSQRYNVEDSISKQFQLKTSTLVYLNDKTRDINHIKKQLKTIYGQRSNIAHGNFGAVSKYVNNLSKVEGKEEYFDDLVVDLYTYIRAILEEYFKDKVFVDFLKNS